MQQQWIIVTAIAAVLALCAFGLYSVLTIAPIPGPAAVATPIVASTAPTSAPSLNVNLNASIKIESPKITDPFKGLPPAEPQVATSATQALPETGESDKPLLETASDGSTMIDHRYKITGKGTEDDPYILHWDMLLSARDSFDPSSGKWNLPARFAILDGKYVQLKGYFAVVAITPKADHVLLTWNMMDVCHGMTPKPFQAVDVKLQNAIDVHPHTLEIMTMSGKFRLDPTLKNGFSLVVFALDDAKLVMIENPIAR